MSKLITSQDHLDDEIVATKIATGDFGVLVSPAFEIDGRLYQVILDGHHSFAAAHEAGVDPEITVATPTDHDAVALLEGGDVETFLSVVHMGSDYVDARTRTPAF